MDWFLYDSGLRHERVNVFGTNNRETKAESPAVSRSYQSLLHKFHSMI